jgi:predicted phosphoribosyltransferase
MQGIVTTELEAKSLQDIIAKALGYPKQGVPVGGGIHASIEQSVTLYYVKAMQHPTRSDSWTCPVDNTVQNIVNDRNAVALLTVEEQTLLSNLLKNVQEIGSDWFSTILLP